MNSFFLILVLVALMCLSLVEADGPDFGGIFSGVGGLMGSIGGLAGAGGKKNALNIVGTWEDFQNCFFIDRWFTQKL
ncbi:unnamed protein product [Caenorhabditis nigoni]